MIRWLGVAFFAVLLWIAAGLTGARMGGPEMGPRSASAGEVPVVAPAWIPLFPPDILRPPLDGRRTAFLPLRTSPSSGAPSAGRIRVVFEPEQGIHTTWLPPEGGVELPLWPDLHDPDYSSGPWHHQTLLEVRGRWALLPADPFPAPVWVDFSALPGPPLPTTVEQGMILVSPRGDVRVLEVLAEGLRVRLEQPADRWCQGGHPPPLEPEEPFLLQGPELRNENGRLRVRPKYSGDC